MRQVRAPMDRRLVVHLRRYLSLLREERYVAHTKRRPDELIEQEGEMFVALRSPDTAEHEPDYVEVGRFSTRAKAEEFLASLEMP
jgi:hypothetical protein